MALYFTIIIPIQEIKILILRLILLINASVLILYYGLSPKNQIQILEI